MELIKEIRYHDLKKKMIAEEVCIDFFGFKQGECKTYYHNRKLAIRCHYKDNKYHGEYKEWYTNGKLCYHFMCAGGLKHGKYKQWDRSGRLISSRYYFNQKDITREVDERTGGDQLMIKLIYGFETFGE